MKRALQKYNAVRVLTPMVYALNLSGCRLLTFAYIQGFCNDEVSVCYSSVKTMSEVIGYAPRTIKEALANLIKDGYIFKIGTRNIGGKNVSGYRTYFFELMDRYDAGEEIKPCLLKTRRGGQNGAGAHCAPVHISADRGAQSALESNKNLIESNNNLSLESAPAREAEEREFYKIFFLRNAADPAAEVRRFIGTYQSKGWTSDAGRPYDSPAKRAGLASRWECKSGPRLPKNENTDKFYSFLRDLAAAADTAPDRLDPIYFFDIRTNYRLDRGEFLWLCSVHVYNWCERHPDGLKATKERWFGAMSLCYTILS